MNYKKWQEEENTFLIDNYKKQGIDYCVIHLKRSKKSIQHQLKKLNLTKNPYWSDVEESLLKLNYESIDIKDLVKLINRSKSAIQYKAYELGLSVDKKLIGNRISESKRNNHKDFNQFKVNPEQFLNITTPEISYILGFLWADGYIRDDYVVMWLKIDDAEHIKHIFEKTGNWNIYYRITKLGSKQMCFHTNNRFIYNFLVENDYLNKSKLSPDKILSNIPNELKHYFFRGYFDGDGTIYHSKKNYQNILNITSTYEQDWSTTENLFKKLNIKYRLTKSSKINKKGILNSCSRIVTQNKDGVIKFCDYIYNDFENDNIGLHRKFKIFIGIKNFYLF
jgi:hypothetical protein